VAKHCRIAGLLPPSLTDTHSFGTMVGCMPPPTLAPARAGVTCCLLTQTGEGSSSSALLPPALGGQPQPMAHMRCQDTC
jgi:hypothetical protein